MSICLGQMFGVWKMYIILRVVVIKSIGIAEFSCAGTDTSSTSVERAMAEFLKNKEAMERVSEELDREINKNPIKESHVAQLPYPNTCLKETLKSRLVRFIAIHAIGRDPSTWEDPLSFKPERFVGSSLDVKGHNFELLPFGSGRRVCPGLAMATRQLPLILASLVHCFDWSLPNGEELRILQS
ncbi:geranylhydroquinone 3''-hydroxylase CYP76B74-like [Mercurialis annua]|uniref:geranylhydroquinone 3''-hydroxylase CYP76B74-like n=1 Tax=Mercurialis annua TaxID=3986 RepID=UPI00215E0408|nr:geranylhydroquinone 3''-hydroxylase CYP76B74-like [Mercurialis annua]